MKTLFTILFFTISIFTSYAQTETCDCKKDLDFMVKKMKTMPSYKHQIKKANNQVYFKSHYDKIANKLDQPIEVYKCYILLNEMMATVKDVHAAVTFDKTYLKGEDYKNEKVIDSFITTSTFKNHPRSTKKIDSLKTELAMKSVNDLEGIYYYKDELTIGLYKTVGEKYEATVLESNTKLWEARQIVAFVSKDDNNQINIARYSIETYNLRYLKSLDYNNGRFLSFRKDKNHNDYSMKPEENSNWEFKKLNNDTSYAYFGNFSSFSKENKETYAKFYAKTKDKFNTKNIIVDLRSNAGGNKKLSDPFFKLIKKSKANIYILTNMFTASNGEQFTVKLKKIKNAKQLGQSTWGIISYGFNHGYRFPTPSGKFTVLPTDMDFHDKFFQYEGIGVVPDIKLDHKTSWIDQTLELIASKI